MRILLVEDDQLLAEGMKTCLKREGFTVNHLDRGSLAVVSMAADPADIMILDLGLPDMDGLSVLREIRQQGHLTPVLILSARDGLDDKVKGLDTGADDYLTKPFETDELFARIRALERRIASEKSAEIVSGPICLNTANHSVTVSGELLTITRKEFMILKALMETPGKVITKNTLETALYSWNEEISSNAVEVHIHNLRKKLSINVIQTIRGVGYRFSA
ncbi:MAG: DNA-binding response regulator [Gammaproteobacteria bacterium]|nr:MAG: DNA-binding response regulator [Gammaproteobacteria bacterium]